MSPVSLRRYRVVFIDYTAHEIIVLADNRPQAIDKAQAHYVCDGLASFKNIDRQIEWTAEEVRP